MKRILSIVLLTFIISNTVFAQVTPKLPSQSKVYMPKVLFKSVLSEAETARLAASANYGQSKSEEPAVKKYWEVYSDRNNNKLYASPDGKIECGELKFNEKVRIAEIKGKYALVYSDPIGTYPEITQHAESKGWIKMDNLLLWSSCPADDKGIYYKALICYNMTSNKDRKELAGYENPSKSGKSFMLNTDLKFYFIMKRVGDMVLLSSEYTLEGESSKVLYAWVPEGAYVPWNQRSCLEPTWEKDDVSYFASKKIVAEVCPEKDLKDALTTFDFKVREGGESDRYYYRMRPDDLRYPILDGSTDVLYEVSSFGSLGGKVTVTTGGAQNTAPSKLAVTQARLDKLSKLNLVIVIDGTASMEKYFPAVKEAINKGSEFFASQHYDMRVGVAIYRDYSDGEGLFEVYPLSKCDDDGLAKFIYSGGKYGIRSSKADRTHTEAVYYGIKEGLKLFKNSEESNIMLVVGDCGNDPEDNKITKESLIKDLVNKNVNFMGFQVRNNNLADWALFNNQMVQVMRQTLQKRYDNVLQGAVKVRPKLTAEGYEMQNELENEPFVGAHKYSVNGSELSAEHLTKLMIESIRYCARAVQNQKDVLVGFDPRRSMGGSNDVVDATSRFNEALVKKMLGKDYDLIQTNTLLSFRGWVKKNDDSGKKLFKPVLFISDKEFQNLLERLAPVNAAAKSNQREPYINAMKALIRSLVPDITDQELDRQGVDQTMKLVAGLNEKSDALKDYTILQIGSRQDVPDNVYLSLVKGFTRKYSTLERIKKDNYKYTRTFNGITYYWIPIEQLP